MLNAEENNAYIRVVNGEVTRQILLDRLTREGIDHNIHHERVKKDSKCIESCIEVTGKSIYFLSERGIIPPEHEPTTCDSREGRGWEVSYRATSIPTLYAKAQEDEGPTNVIKRFVSTKLTLIKDPDYAQKIFELMEDKGYETRDPAEKFQTIITERITIYSGD